MGKRISSLLNRCGKFFALTTVLLLGFSLVLFSVICFAAGVGQSPKPSTTTNISALEIFADPYTTSLIYVGKVVSIDTGNAFGTEYSKTIEFDVQEYIAGGGYKKKEQVKRRTIKGRFVDIVVDKLYIVSQNADGSVTALIPLDDSPDLVGKIKQIVGQSTRRDLIIEKVALEIFLRGKPNWSSVRIYDFESLFLVERFGSHHVLGKKQEVQFIYGCSLGRRIEPYIHIQSLRITGKEASVTGTIHPNSIRFSAELIEARAESGIFCVTRLVLSGYLSDITMYTAVLRGDIVNVKRLIQEGGDVNAADAASQLGLAPLYYAAEHGHKAVAALLIEQGARVNAQDRILQAPLHYAAKNGHKDVAALLIERGALVGAQDIYGYTPLHNAASAGYKDVAELLIAKGADVNAKNKDGWFPLHCAALSDRKGVLELLIARGADVNAKNKKGETPLTFAIRGGHNGVEELLRRYGGKE